MAADLLDQWQRLSAAGLNNRAAAAQLEVSEAQLVASACGTWSERLVPDETAILAAAQRLGTVKWVVRNPYAVLERRGRIDRMECGPDRMLRIDAGGARLELAADKVASAFALTEPRAQGAKRSLQLFDASGVSAVKLVAAVSSEDFQAIVNPLRHIRQSRQEPVELSPLQASGVPGGLRPGALDRFLHRAAALGTPLDIRVRNAAATLGVVSPIRRVKRSERAPWINVLDPDLEIHLHEARIDSFRLEDFSSGAALHWHCDKGEPAVWIGCTGDFESLARAARAEDRIAHPC